MSDNTIINIKLKKAVKQSQKKKKRERDKIRQTTSTEPVENTNIKKTRITESNFLSVEQCACSVAKLSLSSESGENLKLTKKQIYKVTNIKRRQNASVSSDLQQPNGYFSEKVKSNSAKKMRNIKTRQTNKAKEVVDNKNSVKNKIVKNDGTESSDDEIQEQIKDSKDRNKMFKSKDKFPCIIHPRRMKEILNSQDPTNIKYVQGYLRINPRFHKHGYISMANGECDLLIIGRRDRNCAFDGDLVVASINDEKKWQNTSDGQKQRTGTVVSILEEIHPRKAIGYLKQIDKAVFLYPRDLRIPLIQIYHDSLPAMYNSSPSLFKNVLFFAKITKWKYPRLANGRIECVVGTVEDIETEINAILLENCINTKPYHDKLIKGLPSSDYVLTPADIEGREDWRHECIFTIDPSTAVDLDDAVSCKILDNGNFEVGVHISDVTHFLKSDSALDSEVAKRATTVYLANEVYHMLPKNLCTLCSLLPGQDKLTFSVIWEMTSDAQIIKHRFTKTIINSCCQMSYKYAQMMIENSENFPSEDLKISANYTVSQLSEIVNNLFKLSEQLRKKRFADGALNINQPKIRVEFDKQTGLPVSYTMEEQKDSNRLIEEFMLLANMTVAKHLYDTVPEYALLRNHRQPSKHILTLNRNMLQRFGIHLDIESSKELQTSIKSYEPQSKYQSEEFFHVANYRMMVINTLCAKAMMRATYKCSADITEMSELRHYALNVPFYTHFTSPIRRYPDCVVHRLLYTTIKNEKIPKSWTPKMCTKIAKNCNERKYYAKLAEKQSSELYFTYLIGIKGPTTMVAITLDVKEHSIDVILCEVGIKLRISTSELKEEATIKYSVEWSVPTLTVTWKASNITQVITIFSIVYLKIEKNADLFQLDGKLLEPYLQS